MNSGKIYYFAYGSNMDQNDLDRWCTSKSRPLINPTMKQVAWLKGYKLCFNYYSKNRHGGAANIMVSNQDSVWGILMEITEEELDTIRVKEGYKKNDEKGSSYLEIKVDVENLDRVLYKNVITYQVAKENQKSNHQPPTKEYLDLIINNARINKFPPEYIAKLERVYIK